MIATVYTYGHIDSMFYVLNGIAMLTSHKAIMPVVQMMCLLTATYYAIKMAYSGNSNQNKEYLLKTLGILLIINIAIIPKTSMIIKDHISKKQEKVDGIPYGFAVPVAILEHFGDLLTTGFEQAFQVVGSRSTSYRDYGMVFGARLLQEARNWRIKNPEFIENMDHFIKRCIIREAMIGKSYTPQDLLTSSDIWGLTKRHASRIRHVQVRIQGDRRLIPCSIATRVIEESFGREIADLNTKYTNSDFSAAGSEAPAATHLDASSQARVNAVLSTNIQNAFQSQIGANRSAANIIKQQMMINAMHNFSDDYGFVRAASSQEASWRLSGDLSTIYLPMLLTVMKGIFYASFIFLIPIMLLSGGIYKYLGYLSVITSLQLWPALNSILNMFIDLYSAHNLSDISGSVVSFGTMSKIGDYTDKIVAVASGLQMIVPFLAFGIIQGGVSGFMNIAGTITGATQGAASSSAHEVTTGNRSLDNISLSNMQVATQSGFKTDFNSNYASGASSYQHADGTVEKTLGSGETIYTSGIGITTSSGATNIETRMIGSNQTSDTYSNLSSMAKSTQVAFTDQETTTLNHALNSLVSLSKHEDAGENMIVDNSSTKSEITQQAQNYMRHLRDNFGYTHEQAAAAYLKASLDAELGGSGRGDGSNASNTNILQRAARGAMSKVLGGLLSPLGLTVTASLGGNLTATDAASQSLSDETSSAIDNSHVALYSALESALTSKHFASNDSKDKSFADDLRASRDRTNTLGQTLEMRQEDLRSFGSNATNSDSSEMIVTHEARDELVKQIAKDQDIHPLEAHRSLESGSPMASNILKSRSSSMKQGSQGSMQSARQYFTGSERDEEVEAFKARNAQNVNEGYSKNLREVRQTAANQGITEEANTKAMDDIKKETQDKTHALSKEASNELKIKQKGIQMEYKERHKGIKKEEKNRMAKAALGRENDHN